MLYSAYASTLQEVIQDLDESSSRDKPIDLHGFADDHAYKKLFAAKSLMDEINTIGDLENCTTRIKNWMDGSRLKMNNSKTEFIMFGSRKMLTKCITRDININGTRVKKENVIRYMGVWMDGVLSFKYRVKMKCKSAMFNLVHIKRLRPSLTVEAANILVMGLVISHLDYANSILLGVPDVTIKQLQHVQNMAAKVVLQADKYASPRECMKNMHWLPICKRAEHKVLTIVYKCTRGIAPKYLQDLIKKCIPSRPGLHSRGSSTKLVVPCVTRQTFAARAFSVGGPSLWSSLPADITEAPNVEQFKIRFKTRMFKEIYDH